MANFWDDWRLRVAALLLASLLVAGLFVTGVARSAWHIVNPIVSWWKYALFAGLFGLGYYLALRQFSLDLNETLPPTLAIERAFGPTADPHLQKRWGDTLLYFHWDEENPLQLFADDKPNGAYLAMFTPKDREQWRGQSRVFAFYSKKGWRGAPFIFEGSISKILRRYNAMNISEALFKAIGSGKTTTTNDVLQSGLEDDDPAVRTEAIRALNAQHQNTPTPTPQPKL